MNAPTRLKPAPCALERRLTRRQRDVVVLLYAEELDYEGIAARLGITVRTVKMHVEQIATWLDGDGPASWKILRHAEELLERGIAA